jgi:hypothetical protein
MRKIYAIMACAALLAPTYAPPAAAGGPGAAVAGAVVACAKFKPCKKAAVKAGKGTVKKLTKPPKCKGSGSSGTANSTSPFC